MRTKTKSKSTRSKEPTPSSGIRQRAGCCAHPFGVTCHTSSGAAAAGSSRLGGNRLLQDATESRTARYRRSIAQQNATAGYHSGGQDSAPVDRRERIAFHAFATNTTGRHYHNRQDQLAMSSSKGQPIQKQPDVGIGPNLDISVFNG